MLTRHKETFRKIFFFCRPSKPAEFNEPVKYRVKYRNLAARYLLGCLPLPFAKPFTVVHVSERIVEVPFVFASLSVPRGSTVVDLGCAESKLSLELANLGYRVWSVDLRPYEFHHPNLQALVGDFADVPIPEHSVDAVIAVSTLEHLGIAYYGGAAQVGADSAAMEKIRYILKPRGHLILTVPYGVKAETDWYRVYDHKSLRGLLTGFEIDRLEFYRRRDSATWEPTTEEIAAGVASPEETNCVALVSAFAAGRSQETG